MREPCLIHSKADISRDNNRTQLACQRRLWMRAQLSTCAAFYSQMRRINCITYRNQFFFAAGCMMYAATCYFLGLATILSLTALALFRFIKACYPSQGKKRAHSTQLPLSINFFLPQLYRRLPSYPYVRPQSKIS